jgi:hypothetical protein
MQAKYIVFNSNAKAYVSGGKVRYYLSEASARCLDDQLHSIAKVNYKKRSLMEANTDKENTDRVMYFDDEDSFWDCICQYKDNDTLFMVWNDDEWTMRNSTKLKNKQIRIRGVQVILNSMLMSNNLNVKSLLGASELFSASFDVLRASDQSYVTDYLTKLFRKVVKTGRTQKEGFDDLIYLNNLGAISKCTYFRIKKPVEGQSSQENRESYMIEQMVADLRGMGLSTVRRDHNIFVETDTATWWFDYGLKDNLLHYMTKKFYTGDRTLLVERAIPDDFRERNRMIISLIRYKENILKYGVGNGMISKYLHILSDNSLFCANNQM